MATTPGSPGVFTMTNSPSPPQANAVLAFTRQADGSLMPAGSFPTGGFGTGNGLGSQGSVTLSPDRRFLFVVDAGSDQVATFLVRSGGLSLLNVVGSGGRMPISVTASSRFVYVLNTGDTAGISGFTLGNAGLTPLPGSTRSLNPMAALPAEVQFKPAGNLLVVTEKVSNSIDTYTVGQNGFASGPIANASNGTEPFGSAFNGNDRLVVSDTTSNAVTLYAVAAGGGLTPLTPPVPDFQTAPCWVVVTRDGRFAYAANTGSGTISGYRLARTGLSLLNPNGVTAFIDGIPTDMAISGDGLFLYALNGQGIVSMRINADGSLTPVAITAVPPTAVGLAAT